MRSAPARPVHACFVRSCCNVVVQEHNLRASPVQCNVKQALSSHITLHPSHFTSELFSSGFLSSHMSATFFLAIFMSSERSSNFLMRWTYFQLISALLQTNDILHLLGKHSTTWPQRAHHHLSGQRSAVLPRYRLVPCKQLSRLRNNQRRVHI